MKVLVADDSPTDRYALKVNLESWGYEVVEVDDGAKALDLFSHDDPPRIAIIDWMMPGADGVEVVRRLNERRSGPFIYTILLTARNQPEDLVYALESGAHNFQSKPVSSLELHSYVNVGRRLVETEDALVRVERMAAVGTLVRGISHQFNNLNNVILGYAELLGTTPDATAQEQRDWVAKISRTVLRSVEITNILNVIVQPEPAELLPAAIDDLLAEMLATVREECEAKGIRIVTHLGAPPSLSLSKNEIRKVIFTLLQNAQHALIGCQQRLITVASGVKAQRVYVNISDTGCGIPHYHLSQIFTPFFTTKGEFARGNSPQSKVTGLGLGLSLSDRVMRQHGGEIAVESEVGAGSTFTLWFPIKR